MPRPGPRRTAIGVRLSGTGHDTLNARATDEGVTVSELVRRMLKYATAHMPKGWE